MANVFIAIKRALLKQSSIAAFRKAHLKKTNGEKKLLETHAKELNLLGEELSDTVLQHLASLEMSTKIEQELKVYPLDLYLEETENKFYLHLKNLRDKNKYYLTNVECLRLAKRLNWALRNKIQAEVGEMGKWNFVQATSAAPL